MSETVQAANLSSTSSGPLRLIRSYGVWIAALALIFILPRIFTSGFALTAMSLMGITIIFSLSYNMLLGQTGMLSFGHAVYYGLGGFLAVHAMNAIASKGIAIPLPIVPIVGGLTGLLFGVIFGYVSTKRGGTAFAMISLGLAELVASCALILRSFFGGEEGITTNRTKLLKVFDLNFGPQYQVYYLIAFWCLICVIAMYALTRTPFGRMCNAVRENFERSEFVGYNPQLVRFIAFCLAGFFAGIAGALAAINFEIVNSSYVGAVQSGQVLLAAFIGGVGSFIGPILGAVLVTYLQLTLSDITEIWQLYFGLLFVGMVMFAPFGLAGILAMHAPLLRAGTLWRLLPYYVVAAVPTLIMLSGFCLLIELTVHVMVKASDGPMMHFLKFSFDSTSFVPWLVAALLIGGGYGLLRLVWPRLHNAWNEALSLTRQRASTA